MRSLDLPDFPWDTLAPYAATARSHPDGVVDLSIGTPVDSTPEVVQEALRAASDAPGYPQTAGTPALRRAVAGALARRHGVEVDEAAVLPLIGSKELVGLLPTLLGLGPGDRVAVPALAYPTYAVSAAFCGADVVASDDPADWAGCALVWLNSPANPSGRVLTRDELRAAVAGARAVGAVVASDECYLDLHHDGEPPLSVLHPTVTDGDTAGLLAVHSLSKRSNSAGYRGGYVTGDPALVRRLLEVRKHLGLIVPRPVQEAMTAAYADDAHVEAQRAVYGRRREVLRSAFTGAGFRVEHSEAGLYLWLTRDEDCWATVAWLADRGVLVAPGGFYGVAGDRHVRAAFTATDERVAAVADRLS